MLFQLTSAVQGSCLIVSVRGEIDSTVADDLRSALRAAAGDAADLPGHGTLIVDVTGVAYLDSVGLGVLVSTAKHVRSTGSDLQLVAPHHIRRLLEITGLDGFIPAAATLQDATAPPCDGFHSEASS
ncbi:STAS domain-containing protein [Dactylosporangium sp. CS-047395]|uniref:STAS domain-containing protein n=1 Tax=Dactylosporangium sp. CS-047395 TaxID=3239936 RepID=UPI003D8CB697